MLPKGVTNAQEGAFPTQSSHGGEAPDTGNAVHDLRDDVASLEEELSQMGTPSKTTCRFT